jgi:hypothetical protein
MLPLAARTSMIRIVSRFRSLRRAVWATCLATLASFASAAAPQAPLPPLDPSVNSATVIALADFEVKNRICGDIFERRTQEWMEKYAKEHPAGSVYPTGHGEFDEYAWCVTRKPVSLCDTTAGDLRSVRTLLAQDPRLAAFMSFDQLLAERNRQCLPDVDIEALSRSQRRVDLNPRNCKRDQKWYGPPLIPMARMMRSPDPANDLALHYCRANAGYDFLRDHCRKTLDARRRQRRGLDNWLPPELGIEAYLCPLTERDFNKGN